MALRMGKMPEVESDQAKQAQREVESSAGGEGPTAVARLLTAITQSANALACVLVAFMAVAFGYEVTTRYLFNSPTGLVNQFAAYSMPIITFLGAAQTLRMNGHVSVDILTSRLPPQMQARLAALIDSLAVVVLALVTVFAVMTVWESYGQETRSFATAVTFPEFIPQIVMPVGLLLLLLEQLRIAVLGWRRKKNDVVQNVADETTSVEHERGSQPWV